MLLQYALNELDEKRRDEIDGLLVTDPDFSAAMQEAEYDLLDAYAAGELSEQDRARVERALNPAGRFSLEAPGHVIRPAAVIPIAATPRPTPNRGWMYLVAMAAALVLAAIVTTSWWHSRHIAQPSVAQQGGTPVQPSAPPLPTTPPAATAEVRPKVAMIANVLLPGALRSQDALSLTLAQPVTMVRFVWPASSVQPSPGGYELQVVGDDGKESCRSFVNQHKADTLDFRCDAAAIPSGTSFVRVLALPSTPDAAPLLEVTLTVARK
jgi:hypothetical protein